MRCPDSQPSEPSRQGLPLPSSRSCSTGHQFLRRSMFHLPPTQVVRSRERKQGWWKEWRRCGNAKWNDSVRMNTRRLTAFLRHYSWIELLRPLNIKRAKRWVSRRASVWRCASKITGVPVFDTAIGRAGGTEEDPATSLASRIASLRYQAPEPPAA